MANSVWRVTVAVEITWKPCELTARGQWYEVGTDNEPIRESYQAEIQDVTRAAAMAEAHRLVTVIADRDKS